MVSAVANFFNCLGRPFRAYFEINGLSSLSLIFYQLDQDCFRGFFQSAFQ
jgi:hypothetical protein